MEFFGIKFVGVNPENGRKLLLTIGFVLAVGLLRLLLLWLTNLILGGNPMSRGRFWTRQGITLFTALVSMLAILSIWFDDPTRLTTAMGLVTAGLAFALQKVVTSFAGYFVILRGENFSVGDRISMGGVRGDVIALGFIQTTIMEMGQPPAADADPSVWVRSRQFTGRIVTVANAKIFDEPIYNYTRDFPYIWDEIALPITYEAEREKVEEILLKAAKDHALRAETVPTTEIQRLRDKYGLEQLDLDPSVYYRITDNWLELTLRFLVDAHGARWAKDKMSRQILKELDAAGIGIASSTYDIVRLPPLRIEPTPPSPPKSEFT
ncbi:MscS Mechanosensitive ion channel [Chthoniobacter flavus Ellin428]|uniref:MscS Mechanosensitive ion channel n=1 Tax=Chthoniobacter flavus Ellin428 TaxID=497964 RepID=B4D7D3_9BACT|nr:mechanosensitive ion channel domain-containing protein [Chthoniobacter flavus]EDY17550.1 MscS Mechanosensitive ion channel [Chthoniobacter flavus Ellin428]TCO92418.1 small-conductance mechanosensitive channel [Chthoniobacter flavus]